MQITRTNSALSTNQTHLTLAVVFLFSRTQSHFVLHTTNEPPFLPFSVSVNAISYISQHPQHATPESVKFHRPQPFSHSPCLAHTFWAANRASVSQTLFPNQAIVQTDESTRKSSSFIARRSRPRIRPLHDGRTILIQYVRPFGYIW